MHWFPVHDQVPLLLFQKVDHLEAVSPTQLYDEIKHNIKQIDSSLKLWLKDTQVPATLLFQCFTSSLNAASVLEQDHFPIAG